MKIIDYSNLAKKDETPKVGVAVFLLKTKDGDTIPRALVGKRKGSHGAGKISLPGGHMSCGETFVETCAREVFEETGIKIDGVRPFWFGNNDMPDDGLHYITLYFRALWDEEQTPENKEPDKHEDWRWESLEKLSKTDKSWCNSPLVSQMLMEYELGLEPSTRNMIEIVEE